MMDANSFTNDDSEKDTTKMQQINLPIEATEPTPIRVTRYNKSGTRTVYYRAAVKKSVPNSKKWAQRIFDLIEQLQPISSADIQTMLDDYSGTTSYLTGLVRNGYVKKNKVQGERSPTYSVAKPYKGERLKGYATKVKHIPYKGVLPTAVQASVPAPSPAPVQAESPKVVNHTPSTHPSVQVVVKKTIYIDGKEYSEADARSLLESIAAAIGG